MFVKYSSFSGNSRERKKKRKKADILCIPLERPPAISLQEKEPGHSLMELSH